MPANLPPEYRLTEKKLKQARGSEEKISILEKLLTLTPKHKGTERLQKDLKAKIAKLRKESSGKKRGQKETHYYIAKEGAGQLVIAGPPGSGKSSLLNCLTNAKARVGDYSFVTRTPQPAMMPFEDIFIQLVDTPPLTEEFSPPWMRDILANGDGLVLVFDMNGPGEIESFFRILKKLKVEGKKRIIVGSKMDSPAAVTKFKLLKNEYPIIPVSCREKTGLEELKKKMFDLLEMVRVYSKKPNQLPELGIPFTCPKGSRLIEVAGQIHLDFAENFKYARLFRKEFKSPLIVGKDYLLKDGDIVEIHG